MTRDDLTRYATPALLPCLFGLAAAGNALAVARLPSGDPSRLITLLLPAALVWGLWQNRQDTHSTTRLVWLVRLSWLAGGLVGAACWWALPSLRHLMS